MQNLRQLQEFQNKITNYNILPLKWERKKSLSIKQFLDYSAPLEQKTILDKFTFCLGQIPQCLINTAIIDSRFP